MIKMLLIILFIIHYNDAQSSGQRMVFHNGKWKFSGEIREIIISFENNWNVLGVKYSWPEQITPESGKLLGSDGRVLAQGLPMSKTWRLQMEALFRPDNRVSHRTIFHGTDGGSFGHTRCGGRLPGIWTRNAAPPISYGFYFSAFKLLFFLFRKISKIFGTIEDFLSAAV